jgi:hypothetical protein
MTLTLIDPADGFNYPYYLYVPEGYAGKRPILVEPTNTGKPSDDFEIHREAAELRARKQTGRRIADKLAVPLLQPVFPRPVDEPVDWTHSIHQLCARTIRIEGGPLQRVDLQLLAMIDDARQRLAERNSEIPKKVMLTGFSASAAFANRFSVIHPSRVHSVSIGGVNGIVTLPLKASKPDQDFEFIEVLSLNYPVGVADIAELTGESFDMTTFRTINQFIYMGEDDDKDVLLWPDAWTDPELRASAILTYGPDIHADRFPHCAAVYAEQNVPAVFRTYPETGHDPSPAIDDIVTFHKRSLAGAGVEDLDAAIGGNSV